MRWLVARALRQQLDGPGLLLVVSSACFCAEPWNARRAADARSSKYHSTYRILYHKRANLRKRRPASSSPNTSLADLPRQAVERAEELLAFFGAVLALLPDRRREPGAEGFAAPRL